MNKGVINFILVLISILTGTVAIIAIAKPNLLSLMALAICLCCLTATVIAVYIAKWIIYKHNQ